MYCVTISSLNKTHGLGQLAWLYAHVHTRACFQYHVSLTWRNFYRHVVKVEEDYMVKDEIVEETVEEMALTDSDEDSEDEDLIYRRQQTNH